MRNKPFAEEQEVEAEVTTITSIPNNTCKGKKDKKSKKGKKGKQEKQGKQDGVKKSAVPSSLKKVGR